MNTREKLKSEDIYTRVTNQIIEAIEAGAARYRMPWHVTDQGNFSPVNVVSKKPYRGINVLCLWLIAQQREYQSGLWGTYRQWQQLGAQVKSGEKSCAVVFWKVSGRKRTEEETQD